MSRTVYFRVACQADLTETWRSDAVPEDLQGKALEQFLMDSLGHDAHHVADRADNEHDRTFLDIERERYTP